MKQVLVGGKYNALHTTTTEYNGISGGDSWGTPSYGFSGTVSTPGTLRNLRVELNDTPVGGTYTFTLWRAVGIAAGAITTLTCTVAADGTIASDTEHDVTVAAGDIISLECNPSGAPTARYARWTMEFEGDNANESLILSEFYAPTANTVYIQLGNVDAGSLTEADVKTVCPTSGKIKNLYVWLHRDPGTAPDAYRFTLRIANVGNGYVLTDTALTCTITADDRTGNDIAHEVAVAAGDILTIMVEPLNVPTNSAAAVIGMTFVADTDGESVLWGRQTDALNAALTNYNHLTALATWEATEATRYQLAQECTFKKFYVELTGSPGAGKSYTLTIRQEGASPVGGLVVLIEDAATTGNDTTNDISISDGDTVGMMSVPSGSPTNRDAYWGLVCYIEPVEPEEVAKPPTFMLDPKPRIRAKFYPSLRLG